MIDEPVVVYVNPVRLLVNGVPRIHEVFHFVEAPMGDRKPGTWDIQKVGSPYRCDCSLKCKVIYADVDLYYRCPYCGSINHTDARVTDDNYRDEARICVGCVACKRHMTAILEGSGEVVSARVSF